ncbi:MAG: sodium:solute symporter family protein, partial [Gammaproteobacteria bacterium]|nr:sodium:solute symporter family protein [Gammaproteobacteria bacterium]
MLLNFVIIYILLSVAVSLWAARRVHNTSDFYTAGRSLPLTMVTATMFAGWFGAETVMGIPATFMEAGLVGLLSDPLGAAACLILFGVFFAKRLYRLNLLTIGDFYRQRYSRGVEVITGLAIALSYLGWVAAQITALGMLINLLTDQALSISDGIMLASLIVVIYTVVGGLWSVAITTSIQMVITVLSLTSIAWLLLDQVGGFAPLWQHALLNDAFKMPSEVSPLLALAMLTSFLTLAFGSIPQQDVFQRANAARNEQIAAWSAIGGGVLYLLFTSVPLIIAYSAHLIDPSLVERMMAIDGEALIPALIQQELPLFAQIVFYGALVGVILGTSASTLLAPSFMLSENVLLGLFSQPLTDQQKLLLTRSVIVGFTLLVCVYALKAREMDAGLHDMVEA